MINVIFLSVIYSKAPHLTPTITSLNVLDFNLYDINAHLVVWDNSSEGYGAKSLASIISEGKYSYYHSGNNESLSKIYNQVRAEKSKDFDWIVILDDDSVIDENYILEFKKFLTVVNVDDRPLIAIPRIYHQDKMISPGVIKGVRGYLLETINSGVALRNDLVAMMSGTIIKLNERAIPLFDERLAFYGVDTKFYKEALKNGCQLYILNCSMQHDSALRDSSIVYDEYVKRLNNLFKARKIIYEDVPYMSIRLWCYKALFSLKIALTRKNIKYIKLMFI